MNNITDWDGYRQWCWQKCTEFGWFKTTNQESGIFGHSVTLEYKEKWCQDVFGPEFTHEMLKNSMTATNIEYGGFKPNVDNVVFVHGSIDPWHSMGVLEDLHETAPAIYINGTSHCKDMLDDSEYDSEELIAARVRIGELVKEWVQSARK